jgi:hypothetical protein
MDFLAPSGLSSNLVNLLQFIGVGFFLGNGFEHMADAVKNKKVPAIPKPVDTKKLEDRLDVIEKGQLVLNEQIAINQQQASYIITAAGLDRKAPKPDAQPTK